MIAIVAHDAGGAEVVSSYIKQVKLDCVYSLGGPALSIFRRKLGDITIEPIEKVINQCEWLLTGTSWQSDIEWQAIGLARSFSKRSVGFIDHWVNYNERFTKNGEMHIPDEIWVGDTMAETLAARIFPSTSIRLVPNPYYADLVKELSRLPNRSSDADGKINILYICEPVREHAFLAFGNERYWGYTEEEALRYFLSNLSVLGRPVNSIVVRTHPSEPSDKYEWAKTESELPIVTGTKKMLIEEIAECDVVVGCESMALVVGLLAGKRVISCVPEGGKACSLPFPDIEHLQLLID